MPSVLTCFLLCSATSSAVDDACCLSSVASKWGPLGSAKASLGHSPSLRHIFSSRCPRAALFKTKGLHWGLQVPVCFKTFGSRSYNASLGGQSGPYSDSVASLRGGHLALRLASTMSWFGASTSPFLATNSCSVPCSVLEVRFGNVKTT
jgi:hypothetical protein